MGRRGGIRIMGVGVSRVRNGLGFSSGRRRGMGRVKKVANWVETRDTKVQL